MRKLLWVCLPLVLKWRLSSVAEQRQRGAAAGRQAAGQDVWGKGFRTGLSEQTPLAVLLGQVYDFGALFKSNVVCTYV